MKGHIRQRGKGNWSIVLDLDRDENGKRRQKWYTVHGTKKEADRELTRILHEMNTGAFVEASRMTVSEYLKQWLDDYAKTNVSAKTFERYTDIVKNDVAPALGRHQLAKLQPLHIQAFYSKALQSGRKDGKGGLSPQTVLHFHRLIRKALQDAVKWQLIARNPADSVEPPRAVKLEMKVLEASYVKQLLELIRDSVYYMPTLLAVTTGLRRGEILGLQWSDIDLETGVLMVRRSLEQTRAGLSFKEPKTSKSRRVVALPEMTITALQRHKEEQALRRLELGPIYKDTCLVCARSDGGFINPKRLSREFPPLLQKWGLPKVRFHDLRHTHATLLLQEGVHPKIVSERLGHSTIGITLDTYSHVLPSMQEEAARKLNNALQAAPLR